MHAKCNRCGADNKPMTDYEFWGRVEWYCDDCFEEMNRKSGKDKKEETE